MPLGVPIECLLGGALGWRVRCQSLYQNKHTTQQRIDDKNIKCLRWHNKLNYMLIPVVCTAFRAISSEALRFNKWRQHTSRPATPSSAATDNTIHPRSIGHCFSHIACQRTPRPLAEDANFESAFPMLSASRVCARHEPLQKRRPATSTHERPGSHAQDSQCFSSRSRKGLREIRPWSLVMMRQRMYR